MDGNTALILQILQHQSGCFFSCREIFSTLFEKYEVSLTIKTVRSALESLEIQVPEITSRIEHTPERKIPLKTFAYITTISQSN